MIRYAVKLCLSVPLFLPMNVYFLMWHKHACIHPAAHTYSHLKVCTHAYVHSESIMKRATNVARKNLISLGTCIGKFTKSGKFHLQITALDLLAPYAKVSLLSLTTQKKKQLNVSIVIRDSQSKCQWILIDFDKSTKYWPYWSVVVCNSHLSVRIIATSKWKKL